MNVITLPFEVPRLIVRALDDLHTLAEVASALPEMEARVHERFDGLERRAERMIKLGREMEKRADEVVVVARDVVATIPTLEQAIEVGALLAAIAEPLQGTTERLGRIVNRLPGGSV